MGAKQSFTPGPWAVDEFLDLWGGKKGLEEIGSLHRQCAEVEANARLIAAAPELLSELQAAHQIIRNALAVMTTEQKGELGRRNASDGVEGEGITRANERQAAIAKATGEAV